jgi:hypothetical protein
MTHLIKYQPHPKFQESIWQSFLQQYEDSKDLEKLKALEILVTGKLFGTTGSPLHNVLIEELVDCLTTYSYLRTSHIEESVSLIYLQFLKNCNVIAIKDKYKTPEYQWFRTILTSLYCLRDKGVKKCPLGPNCPNQSSCPHSHPGDARIRTSEGESSWKTQNIKMKSDKIVSSGNLLVLPGCIVSLLYLKNTFVKNSTIESLDADEKSNRQDDNVTLKCTNGGVKVSPSYIELISEPLFLMLPDDTVPILPFCKEIVERALDIERKMDIKDNNRYSEEEILCLNIFAFWAQLERTLDVITTIVVTKQDSMMIPLITSLQLNTEPYNRDNKVHAIVLDKLKTCWFKLIPREIPLNMVELIYQNKDLTLLSISQVVSLSIVLSKRRGTQLSLNVDTYLQQNFGRVLLDEQFPSLDVKTIGPLITVDVIKDCKISGIVNVLKFLKQNESKSVENIINICVSRIFTKDGLDQLDKRFLERTIHLALDCKLELAPLDAIISWSLTNVETEELFVISLIEQTDPSASVMMTRMKECFTRRFTRDKEILVKYKNEWVRATALKYEVRVLLNDNISKTPFWTSVHTIASLQTKGSEKQHKGITDDKNTSMYDVRDTEGTWLKARVEDRKTKYIKVRYLRWGTNWDEWIKSDSSRLAHFKSKTGDTVNIGPLIGKRIVEIDRSNVGKPKTYDVLDNNTWRKGAVIDHKDEQVRIHYINWKERWDEWIALDSNRLKPLGSKVTIIKNPPNGKRDFCMCDTCEKQLQIIGCNKDDRGIWKPDKPVTVMKLGQWIEAGIVAESSTSYTVRFVGWGPNWDEIIQKGSLRIKFPQNDDNDNDNDNDEDDDDNDEDDDDNENDFNKTNRRI